MKALTVCQPYAFLLLLPDGDPRKKRVENRNWITHHRGEFAIHAGLSKDWLDSDDSLSEKEKSELVFGAVLGIGVISDCISLEKARTLHYSHPLGWVKDHRHTSGPYLWIIEHTQKLIKPVPARGAQGLWNWDEPAGCRP